MPLLARARFEVYVPDLPRYRNLLVSFEEEFTYAFGGCTTASNLNSSYLLQDGSTVADRINLIYSDVPIDLSQTFEVASRYADELMTAAFEALSEESVLVTVIQIYHAA